MAKVYLEKKYKDIKWVSQKSNQYGYDIKANDQYFEIKTSQSKVGFEITSHEVTVAHRYKDNYWIFFITINEKFKTAEGYMIRNPLTQFHIDPNNLLKPVDGEKVIFSPDRFSVTVEEFIDNLERIDLSGIYKKLIE